MVTITRSILLFVLAGICEVSGGWLIWQSLKLGKPIWWSLVGGVLLVLYGIIPIMQSSHFGRVYAVYGGFFIIISLLWGWVFDGNKPDTIDIIGTTIALIGVFVMMYWPR